VDGKWGGKSGKKSGILPGLLRVENRGKNGWSEENSAIFASPLSTIFPYKLKPSEDMS